jgi:hypothetical protein
MATADVKMSILPVPIRVKIAVKRSRNNETRKNRSAGSALTAGKEVREGMAEPASYHSDCAARRSTSNQSTSPAGFFFAG